MEARAEARRERVRRAEEERKRKLEENKIKEETEKREEEENRKRLQLEVKINKSPHNFFRFKLFKAILITKIFEFFIASNNLKVKKCTTPISFHFVICCSSSKTI